MTRAYYITYWNSTQYMSPWTMLFIYVTESWTRANLQENVCVWRLIQILLLVTKCINISVHMWPLRFHIKDVLNVYGLWYFTAWIKQLKLNGVSQTGYVCNVISSSALCIRTALSGSAEAGALLWFALLGCHRHTALSVDSLCLSSPP